MDKVKSVDEYISNRSQWKAELKSLRKIISSTNLEETIKWGAPIYTLQGKNIVGLGAFKTYVGIWFHQGVFLKDKKKKLINAQEGITKALRQWRFNGLDEINKESKNILEYVKEAIENQKSGKEIKPEKKKTMKIPNELNAALKNNLKLNKSFNKFTPGKKREFYEYIYEAKKDETKLKRIEKITPLILKGIGLNDKYKKN